MIVEKVLEDVPRFIFMNEVATFEVLISFLNENGLFEDSSFGDDYESNRVVDENVRKSKHVDGISIDPHSLKKMIPPATPMFRFPQRKKGYNDELLEKKWKLLKYETGGHFGKHQDKSVNQSHVTILLFPPAENRFEGGDLVFEKKTICPSTFDHWTLVFFHHFHVHSVTPVTRGERYVFKTEEAFYISPYEASEDAPPPKRKFD